MVRHVTGLVEPTILFLFSSALCGTDAAASEPCAPSEAQFPSLGAMMHVNNHDAEGLQENRRPIDSPPAADAIADMASAAAALPNGDEPLAAATKPEAPSLAAPKGTRPKWAQRKAALKRKRVPWDSLSHEVLPCPVSATEAVDADVWFEVDGRAEDLSPQERAELCAPTGKVGPYLIEGGSLVPPYMRRLRVLFGEPAHVTADGQLVPLQYRYTARSQCKTKKPFVWTARLDEALQTGVRQHGEDWVAILMERDSQLRHLTPYLLRERWARLNGDPQASVPLGEGVS